MELPPHCHPLCPPQSDPLMSLMGFGGMDFDSDKAYRYGKVGGSVPCPPTMVLETLKVVLGTPEVGLGRCGTPQGSFGAIQGGLEAHEGIVGAPPR